MAGRFLALLAVLICGAACALERRGNTVTVASVPVKYVPFGSLGSGDGKGGTRKSSSDQAQCVSDITAWKNGSPCGGSSAVCSSQCCNGSTLQCEKGETGHASSSSCSYCLADTFKKGCVGQMMALKACNPQTRWQ